MKVGCQTIIFGRNIDNLDWVLSNLANLGFTGVEFYQHPKRIWLFDHELAEYRQATIEDIVIRLRQYGLAFLGLASGTLQERIDFCATANTSVRTRRHITDSDCTPLYQYVEDLDDPSARRALQNGVNLGFHPHAFTKYERFDQAKGMFENAGPNLYWLPDTAHMMVVGEDPVDVLSNIPLERTIAVHLKAYNPAYGRAYHRYARGFVPLSEAHATVLRCIQTLESRNYDGWYVVEQDSSHTDPITSLSKSVDWLVDHGFMNPARKRFDLEDAWPLTRHLHIPEEVAHELGMFASRVYRASDARIDTCYQAIAKALAGLIGAEYVSLWSWNQPMMDVRLVASYPEELHKGDEPWKVAIDSPALGSVRHSMDAEEFEIASLTNEFGMPNVSYERAAQATGAKFTFTFAIPNIYNPHAIRLLICGITRSRSPYDYADLVELIADDISRAANAALDNASSVAAASVNLAADEQGGTAEFLECIADTIKLHIRCEAVSIFLESRGGERLEARYAKQLLWRQGLIENEKCYRASELVHPTVKCWKECRIVLTDSGLDPGKVGGAFLAKSREVVPPGSEDHDDVLIVPLVAVYKQSDGIVIARAIGVIRCRNKQVIECPIGVVHRPFFTDDDAAIVSAVCQAAVPHVDSRLRDEVMTSNIAGMTHELNMPVNALPAAIDRLHTLIAHGDYRTLDNLAEDMSSWTGLMGKIIDMVDLFGKRNKPLEPECERIGLFGDVIAPLKPVMKKLLDNRKFSVENIRYAPFETLPLLYLDRNLFQMVFFNLFSNAIKYAIDDPGQFEVQIDAELKGGEFQIHFSDYGPGIDETYATSVFEHGMRGPSAMNKVVKGMGLGLWVVRRVVEAHEGRVKVTNFHLPTTITIYLPEARRSSAPAKLKKGS